MQQDVCKPSECAHYIGKDRIGLYRGKFIWTIIVATALVVALFVLFSIFYSRSINRIVEQHRLDSEQILKAIQPLTVSPDSCLFVNEQLVLGVQEHMHSMEDMLQLQSHRIESDFSLLSIWAGILMIVFLVFSIYSMYKTDELIKQGREGVKSIEQSQSMVNEHIKEIDEHVKTEMDKVSSAASKKTKELTEGAAQSMDDIKSSVNDLKEEFLKMIVEKTAQFQTIYDTYVEKLEAATNANQEALDGLLAFLQARQQSVQKDSTIVQKEEGGEK